jgi:hypothetical protein
MPATKTLIPLEISRQAVLTMDHIQRLGIDESSRRMTIPVHRLNMKVPYRVSDAGVLEYFCRVVREIVRCTRTGRENRLS